MSMYDYRLIGENFQSQTEFKSSKPSTEGYKYPHGEGRFLSRGKLKKLDRAVMSRTVHGGPGVGIPVPYCSTGPELGL